MAWIKLHKKLLTWEWYDDSKMVHLFIHLLITANYEESQYRGRTIYRGQTVTGRSELSKTLGMTENQIRYCLSKLELTNEIKIYSTNKYSIVTICKYESYQGNNEKNNQQNYQPAADHPPTILPPNHHTIRSKEEIIIIENDFSFLDNREIDLPF